MGMSQRDELFKTNLSKLLDDVLPKVLVQTPPVLDWQGLTGIRATLGELATILAPLRKANLTLIPASTLARMNEALAPIVNALTQVAGAHGPIPDDQQEALRRAVLQNIDQLADRALPVVAFIRSTDMSILEDQAAQAGKLVQDAGAQAAKLTKAAEQANAKANELLADATTKAREALAVARKTAGEAGIQKNAEAFHPLGDQRRHGWVCGHWLDLDHATWIAELTPDAGGLLLHAARRARGTLTRHRAAWRRLAVALDERGRLTGAEAQRIFNVGRGGTAKLAKGKR